MSAFVDANDLLFQDPNLARDAVWRASGSGAGVAVRILTAEPDRDLDWRETRLVVGAVLIDVRVAEAPTLARGDTFALEDGAVLEVTGAPKRDDLALTWRAEARVR
jgi:hypothetical protein